jgi:hypothetical protein
MNNFNFQVILFKNNKKKKILKSFITEKRANEFYNKKIDESSKVIFPVEMENGKKCKFKIALVSSEPNFDNIYYLDELGRNVSINPKISDSLYIKKINTYNKEEKIFDVLKKEKLTTNQFFKNYIKKGENYLLSKLNNKLILQNDENFVLFSLKTDDDCGRFLNCIEYSSIPKTFMIVRDVSSPQRKYIYELLKNAGFDIGFLYRSSTTHPKEK